MKAKACLEKIISQRGVCGYISCISDKCVFLNTGCASRNHQQTLELARKELQIILDIENKLKFLEELK